MLNRPEILAPAGSMESLKAAVNAGADACYVGGLHFSARAFAGNFNTTELLEAIDYCHINNVRIYMAVNTLLKNDEIKSLYSFIEPFFKEGMDGIIVQDMGVIKFLSEEFPDLPLHGSTQLSICSAYGASFLRKIGLSRLVPAREISLEEIKKIKNSVDIEIEAFVHGAMCFSYSGKCLMSSFAGGRSGNRGRCAQPCRKAYDSEAFSKEYALSMKDMCTLSMLPDLIDAGIDSFKIEGRMKKPEYVAATVQAYSEVCDAYLDEALNDKLIEYHTKRLADIYNRGGFSNGYYYMQNGKSMLANKRPNHTGMLIGRVLDIKAPEILIKLKSDINKSDIFEIRTDKENIELTSNTAGNAGETIRLNGRNIKQIKKGMPVYRVRNNKLISEIEKNIIDVEKKQEIYGKVTAHIGEPVTLEIYSEYTGASVRVSGDVVCEAVNKPISINQITDKLSKTGGMGVNFSLECDADENIFLPLSSLNPLKREAIRLLNQKNTDLYKRQSVNKHYYNSNDSLLNSVTSKKNVLTEKPNSISGCMVSVKTKEQLEIIKNFKIVETVLIDYNIAYDVETKANRDGKRYLLTLPDILREKNVKSTRKLLSVAGRYDGIVIKNVDQVGFLLDEKYTGAIIFDSFLYAYNDPALSFYEEIFDNIYFISSAELTHNETARLSKATIEKLYGYQPVMITAQCFAGNYKNQCGCNKLKFSFKDENNNKYYGINYCSECYSVIYNGVPTNNIDKIALTNGNGYLIDFTIEDEGQTVKVMEQVTGVAVNTGEFTRGHYFKGID